MGRLGRSALSRRLRDAITEAVAEFGVPGAQVAWLHDGAIEQIDYGATGWGRSAPVLADTRFLLGSITKPFTATLALQLVDDGLLELDAPIADALPEGECRDVLGGLSLRQLLTHTSGLENDNSKAMSAFRSPREYVRAYERDKDRLLFSPGRHFSYANAGYILAGYLIEAATGRPWAEMLQSFVLDPLEVRGTFFLSEQPGAGTLTDGHLRQSDGEIVRLTGHSLGRALAPAGGLALNASGLLRLVQLNLSGGCTAHGFQLLDSSLVSDMRADLVTLPQCGFADAWGLAWALFQAGQWFGHDGDSEGSTAHVRANADEGFALALMTNCIPAHEEWLLLLDAVRSVGVHVGEPTLPKLPSHAPMVDPGIVGRYDNGMTYWVVVQRADGFWLAGGEEEPWALKPVGRDRFMVIPAGGKRTPFLMAFLRDPDDQVRYVHVAGRVARRVGN
jgi:CubicO group peptidase (beta-lactamase class C family)